MLKRLLIVTAFAGVSLGVWVAHIRAARSPMRGLPTTTLWAWQRPENLKFLDTQKSAVAVLAATITLANPEPKVEHRVQPISMPKAARHMAVFRIEAPRQVDLTEQMRHRTAYEVCEHSDYSHPSAVQIDFDATASQRDFYRALLKDVRACLPKDTPLSITALVSWCEGDDWIADLPIDEAVPMYFRMGVDTQNIRRSHWDVSHLHEPLCRNSVGVSLDEPWPRFDYGVRVYAFAPSAWTESDYHHLLERLAR